MLQSVGTVCSLCVIDRCVNEEVDLCVSSAIILTVDQTVIKIMCPINIHDKPGFNTRGSPGGFDCFDIKEHLQ